VLRIRVSEYRVENVERLRGGQAIIWPSGRGLKELPTWTRPSLDPAKRYFVYFLKYLFLFS
jgi:hypothetical protein